jgi:hypothetical protein
MRHRRLTTLVVCLLVVASCSTNDRDAISPPTPDTTEESTAPATTSGSAITSGTDDQGADSSSGDASGLIDVTALVRPENIYAAAAANAIAATAAQATPSGPVSWQTLLDSTVAIDTIEYPEIVEGLEVLEIDESAVRVLTATTAGEWGESYVCLTAAGVVASETLCTE